ncbi:hypothetical protein JL721_6316 [Aureococcus anophagefferens]|nr:hypothetical protein JL721_6316 [Aureococcus anophagefferens]
MTASSSEAPKAHLGVTPPINTDMPAEHDAAASEALVHTLRELGVYESDAGKAVRTGVLDRLRAIADAWCENEWALAIAERACDGADCERALAASAPPRCELRTFGSVRLDVHTPDADIDVVLVAPRHCTRRAFFDTLVAALEGDAHIGAGGVMAVRDAATNAAPSTVVGRFFRIFDGWDWPNPVLIAAPGAPPSSAGDESVASRYAAWNPRLNPRDRAHLAPIVTPAHPTMNSSYNVGAPQLRAIKDELSKGLETTRRVEKLAAHWRADESPTGDRAADLRDAWRRLFAPSDFFTQHRHYVQVDVSAADDAGLRKWNAWCESRLRNLVVALDAPGYVRARPHATHVEREVAAVDDAGEAAGATKKTRSYFVALSFETHVQHIDLTPCVREFSNRQQLGARSSDMDLELRHAQGAPARGAAPAAVARGVDLAAAFLGRVGPVPVIMMELEKDASAYSSMTAAVKAWKGFGFDIQEEVDDAMDRTCDGRDEDHCQDQCSWDDDDEICRKNEAYYASSRSSCMCGGYAIEYVPLFFAIHGDKETPKNIQQRAIHEYAHAFQFSRGGVWANFLVEGGAVLLECVVGEYYDDWGGDLEPWAYCLREVARNALEVYAYGNWTRAVPSKAALTVDWECPGDDPWPAADPANMQRKVFYDLAAVVVLFAAVTDWTGDEKVDDIFAAADAWLATATIDDVLARFAPPGGAGAARLGRRGRRAILRGEPDVDDDSAADDLHADSAADGLHDDSG